MKELIKKLVEAWGPSGFEHQVRALIKEEVADFADEISTDSVGNLICKMGSGGKKVMVAAHMDEIGVIATYQDEAGFFRFSPLGGVFPETLTGHRVRFENGAEGVLHHEGMWARNETIPLTEFFIDVQDGEATAGVEIGDPASMWRTCEVRGDRVTSKAMDDRIGCVVAIEAMRKLKAQGGPKNETYFVFTVQEEVGIRGAKTSAFGIEPELGIALDVTGTCDTPGNTTRVAVGLGKGAAIKVYDRSLVVPPEVKMMMVAKAEEKGIPYQMELLPFGGTDAGGISLAKAGAPAGCISIPCRYVHTTSETVDLNDIQASVDLLTAILEEPVVL